MKNRNDDIVLTINDTYTKTEKPVLKDTVHQKLSESRTTPKGRVEIYTEEVDGTRELHTSVNLDEMNQEFEGDNLVVWRGREWLASRIFNVDPSDITLTSAGVSANQFIYWAGLGSGGATSINPPNDGGSLLPPQNDDTDLITPVPIADVGDPAGDADCSDAQSGKYYKHKIDNVVFEQDSGNGNKYLVAKTTIVFETTDANGTSGQLISEAGLFAADATTTGSTYNGPYTMMCHITFPQILKTNSRRLVIIWYIYV